MRLCFFPGRCPEDYREISDIRCNPDPTQCVFDDEDFGQWRHPYSDQPVPAKPERRVKRSANSSSLFPEQDLVEVLTEQESSVTERSVMFKPSAEDTSYEDALWWSRV